MRTNIVFIKYIKKIVEFREKELIEEGIINDGVKKELKAYIDEWEEEMVLRAKTLNNKQKSKERYELIEKISNRLILEGRTASARNISKEMKLFGVQCSNVTVSDVLKRHELKKVNVEKLYEKKNISHKRIITKAFKNKYRRYLK